MTLAYNIATKLYLLSKYNLFDVPFILPLVYLINCTKSRFGETHV
jgi:hypothetical protein